MKTCSTRCYWSLNINILKMLRLFIFIGRDLSDFCFVEESGSDLSWLLNLVVACRSPEEFLYIHYNSWLRVTIKQREYRGAVANANASRNHWATFDKFAHYASLYVEPGCAKWIETPLLDTPTPIKIFSHTTLRAWKAPADLNDWFSSYLRIFWLAIHVYRWLCTTSCCGGFN